MRDILYTVANDKSGSLITATDAEKGNDFYCPVCQTALILKKSGKTGKGAKRPHFAHQSLTPSCTPETALHYVFKHLLRDKIGQHITGKNPLPISWKCENCYVEHHGDLVKKAKSVEIEHNLTVCKPDIALLDKDNRVFAVIEVVVTHLPEENVVKHYHDNNIVLIQLDLKSDKDIDDLENKIASPDLVRFCLNPKCASCGNFQQKTLMTIVDARCWKCHTAMKVAIVEGGQGRGGSHLGPDKFTRDEVEIARNSGVVIRPQYSRTRERTHLANSCPRCGGFVGDHYLFTDYFVLASYGELKAITLETGYHCDHCAERLFLREIDG